MGKIIAVINNRSNVWKTVTSANLALALGNSGKRVLAIDLSHQADLGVALGRDRLEFEDATSIVDKLADIKAGKTSDWQKGIIRITDNVSLLPANSDVATVEEFWFSEERRYLLKEYLEYIKDYYDFIILDCPPSVGYTVINAASAADSIIIPVAPKRFSNKDLEILLGALKEKGVSDRAKILITRVEGVNDNNQLRNELRRVFPDIPIYDGFILEVGLSKESSGMIKDAYAMMTEELLGF